MDKDVSGWIQEGFHDPATCEACAAEGVSTVPPEPAPDRDLSPVSPDHYKLIRGVESIDVIYAALEEDQFIGFCVGNILKYLHRANRKAYDDDLRKAVQYAKWLGEALDGDSPTHS